ncbi:MAG: hypothetical protein Q9221_004822 [Calogaya cf. arnoldii]
MDDIKKKAVRAISALPTSAEGGTTYNLTRAPGSVGIRQVTYLLPRKEPAGDPNPVLWVGMGGNQPTKCAAWDIWRAAVALNTLCVQDGRTGLAYNLGESISGKARS